MFELILNFIDQYLYLLAALLCSQAVLICVFIKLAKYIGKGYIERYSAVQKIHESQVSRLAGLGAVLSLFLFYAFLGWNNSAMMPKVLIYFLPVLIATIPEDLHITTSPMYRLIAMAVSAILFFTQVEITLPEIDIPLLQPILTSPGALPLFYIIATMLLMNGCNFIDGTNGLLLSSAIISFASLGVIVVQDDVFNTDILMVIIPTLLVLLTTMAFNYPFGKLFLGDIGAYWIGWSLAITIIWVYGSHPDLVTWSAPLLIFYPIMEVIFSFVRKIYQKKSPFKPDRKHLHLKLYFLLQKSLQSKRKTANNLTMPCLAFFWLIPPLVAIAVNKHHHIAIFSLVLFSLLYGLFFKFIPELQED